jgi:hypothetical protein
MGSFVTLISEEARSENLGARRIGGARAIFGGARLPKDRDASARHPVFT